MSFLPRTLLTLALCAWPLLAQQAAPAPQPAIPVAPKEPEEALNRDFKTRLFLVQHRSPSALCGVLRPLTSGARGCSIDFMDRDGLKTISVRDFPENVATIEAALKRLDVPQATQSGAEVELHIHVLFAHKTEGSSDGFPEELKEVLRALKSTLAYRSFTPVTSFVHRAKDGARNISGQGSPEAFGLGDPGDKGAARLLVEYRAGMLEMNLGALPSPQITLTKFSLSTSIHGTNGRASVDTDLTLKDGERVVVGTSTLKDRGLIVVVTAKVLK